MKPQPGSLALSSLSFTVCRRRCLRRRPVLNVTLNPCPCANFAANSPLSSSTNPPYPQARAQRQVRRLQESFQHCIIRNSRQLDACLAGLSRVAADVASSRCSSCVYAHKDRVGVGSGGGGGGRGGAWSKAVAKAMRSATLSTTAATCDKKGRMSDESLSGESMPKGRAGTSTSTFANSSLLVGGPLVQVPSQSQQRRRVRGAERVVRGGELRVDEAEAATEAGRARQLTAAAAVVSEVVEIRDALAGVRVELQESGMC